MSVADEISNQSRRHGGRCRVPVALQQLPAGEVRDGYADAIAASSDTYPAQAVARAMVERGVDIGPWSISRHRAGGCRCGR